MFTEKLFIVLVLLLLSFKGAAADFSVTTTDDLIDLNPGDGVCEATINANDCSLRAAIMETNALSSSDSITMPAGVFILSRNGDDNAALVGDLDVTNGQLTIQGVSRESTIIDGNGTDRIFEFNDSDITLQNMTLRNGGDASATDNGGAIRFLGTSTHSLSLSGMKFEDNRANTGGALYANSPQNITVNIINSLFNNNTTFPLGIVSPRGPAIYCKSCNLNINSSTVSFNQFGGKAIYLEFNNFRMTNSTISHNQEGGIFSVNSDVLIKFSTLVDNGLENLENFIFLRGGVGLDLKIANSVLRTNTSENCTSGAAFDMPISLGYNIVNDESCDFSMIGDRENTDPELGELTNNGGSTATHLPSNTSLLIDQVPVADCLDTQGIALLTDQRGQPRPFGSLCDIGAVEVNDGIIFINGFE